jgi:AcrR family transcriptional regulator
VPSEVVERPVARQRILETAARLFYAEGIRAVGVDRIVAESGVAKATLYQQFRSKDELVAVCLQRYAERWRRDFADPVLASRGSVGSRVGGVFDRLGKAVVAPGFRGCPFINAAAEYPDRTGPVASAIAAHRTDVRNLFTELLADLVPLRRAVVADQLTLIFDGTMVGAQHGDGASIARAARRAAGRLLEGLA